MFNFDSEKMNGTILRTRDMTVREIGFLVTLQKLTSPLCLLKYPRKYQTKTVNAEVVCKMLDCGFAMETPLHSHFGQGSGPVIGPKDCGHQRDVAVICSAPRNARLEGGKSRCSGRLEIPSAGNWETVCDRHWDLNNANVVCAQLGCGVAVPVTREVQFGEGTGPIRWNRFEYGSWPLRLTNGESRCDGRVEIKKGSWGRVQDSLWDLNDADVVCRQLDCGSAIAASNSSKYGEGEGPVWVNEVQCKGNESHLYNCNSFTFNSTLTDSTAVGVLCSGHEQIRLSDGGSRCAGRVEVHHNGIWGSVCADSWELLDAAVVCRQLDCGHALDRTFPASCGPASGPVWLQELNCFGNESFLWDCPSASWNNHDCARKNVNIMCSGPVLGDYDDVETEAVENQGGHWLLGSSSDDPFTWTSSGDLSSLESSSQTRIPVYLYLPSRGTMRMFTETHSQPLSFCYRWAVIVAQTLTIFTATR
ncbi:deleted in malignant brain tumors 1 protein-like [Scyliorhinus canicula]|uniref:deleted in malignant brain tumors 1 protein-like n=1 Tax=Scyliorhinus canicula TaxID=7830 RepID=UPI0018F7A241|nr:deleted in malignant brain tumors 1 protein-like [Scyliorhinus canicula]